jgi:hypothetical protein
MTDEKTRRSYYLFPMIIGSLWAIINENWVQARLQSTLGPDEAKRFAKSLNEIAMSFYD